MIDTPFPSMPKVLNSTANILLVEDLQSEVFLTRMSLDNANMPYHLSIVRMGADVIPHLENPSKPKPDLILLDLNLPDMSGMEIMEELLKKGPEIRAIPIIILSGMQSFEDIKQKYALNIVAYLNKPLQPADMREALLHLKLGGGGVK